MILITGSNVEPNFRDGVPFIGGALWIDLLNSTLSLDGGVTRVDFLDDDDAFARWLAHAGLTIDGDPITERQALADLRHVLRAAFDPLAADIPLAEPQIAAINAWLAGASYIRQIAYDRTTCRHHVREMPLAPPRSLANRIATDFAHFLTDYEPARLKHCANPVCTLVFYDRGKNSRRRWCSPAVCGNRDKVANYRARKAIQPSPSAK